LPASLLMPILDRAIRDMWPRRAQKELLLDLGERKGWDGTDYEAALASACAWLSDELGLGTAGTIAEMPAAPVSLVTVRQLASDLAQDGPSSGVAKWAEAIAPAVGSTPKTLANSLTRGLRPDRADHRWLVSLAQAAGEAPTAGIDAWLYLLLPDALHPRSGVKRDERVVLNMDAGGFKLPDALHPRSGVKPRTGWGADARGGAVHAPASYPQDAQPRAA
jgi:hypothetical protein